MLGGCLLGKVGGWAIRATLGGPLPTQEQLDAIIADHPLMKLDHSTTPKQ